MKVQYGTTEEKSIGQLKRQFIVDPSLQAKVRFSATDAEGSTVLAWHRGRLAGVYDAYLTLKEEHPRIAKKLRETFGMSEDGSISSG